MTFEQLEFVSKNLGWIVASKSKQFVYFKCAKTAGTSIKHVLKRTVPDLYYDYGSSISDFSGEDFDKYKTFISVRNPYDRFLSAYFYLRDHSEYPLCRSIDEFCDNVDDVLSCRLDHDGLFRHTSPISSAADGIEFTDVIRYESLREDSARVLKSVGVDSEIPWMEKSRRESRGTLSGHTDYSIRFTQSVYEKDFEMFGYLSVPPTASQSRTTQAGRSKKAPPLSAGLRRLLCYVDYAVRCRLRRPKPNRLRRERAASARAEGSGTENIEFASPTTAGNPVVESNEYTSNKRGSSQLG